MLLNITFYHHSAIFPPDALSLGSGLGVFALSPSLGHFEHFSSFSVDEKRKSKSTPVILAEIAKEEGL